MLLPPFKIMAQTQISTTTRNKIKYPTRYNVIFHNDDFTPMDFVIQLLVEIFDHNLDSAHDITMKIHHEGAATAGTYSKEVAEQKSLEANTVSRHSGYQLKITYEPA